MSSVFTISDAPGFSGDLRATEVLASKRKTAWLQAVSHLDPKYGGLSSAVPELSSAVAKQGRRPVKILGFCSPGENYLPQTATAVSVRHLPLGHFPWLANASLSERIRQMLSDCSGVHVHGLWQQTSAVIPRFARQLRLPYMVSAHGMLERWAMTNKGIKKGLYWKLLEGPSLSQAACLHALTEAEAADYRRLGLHNPVAVIPNGVALPEAVSPALFLNAYPELRQREIILFLGRIHFKKGLDILCQAWANLGLRRDQHLVLAGPDFEGTKAQVTSLVQSLGIQQQVTFTGMLTGKLKWSALAAAEAFILPSYSEGLSVSVLEAMGAAKPVIISQHCNLPDVARHGCGWVVPATASAVEEALTEFFGTSNSTREQMGGNGRRLIQERYTWDRVGQQMNEVYRWLEGGPLPASVNLQSAGKGRA